MNAHSRQRGAVLVVSLLMLLVATILAVSTIQTGTANLRIAGNMQATPEARDYAQRAVNEVLADIDKFNSPASGNITITDADGNGHTVSISQPECVAKQTATGYSASWGLAPLDTTWQFTATIQDEANATIEQGVKIRMTAGSCP